MFPSSSRPDQANAGFTLVEAVVTLAVVAVVAAAIASLSASNRRAVGGAIDHIQVALAARGVAIETAPRRNLGAGPRNGQYGAFGWRYDSRLLEIERDDIGRTAWTPYRVMVEVMGPGGARVSINSIRLRRTAQ